MLEYYCVKQVCLLVYTAGYQTGNFQKVTILRLQVPLFLHFLPSKCLTLMLLSFSLLYYWLILGFLIQLESPPKIHSQKNVRFCKMLPRRQYRKACVAL